MHKNSIPNLFIQFYVFFTTAINSFFEFKSHKDAYTEVSKFMKRYNTSRIHSSLKYKTPNEFYAQKLGKEVETFVVIGRFCPNQRGQSDFIKLTMLEIGNALVTVCYKICFALNENNNYFLVDVGV